MKSRYEWLLGCAVIVAAGGIALALEEGTPTPKADPAKPDPVVEAWVATIASRITDGNEVVRRSAVHAMIAVGPGALPALGKMAGSDDAKTSGIAMDLIAAIKHGGPGERRGPGGPGGPPPMGPGGPGGPPPMGGPHGMRGPGGPRIEDLGLSEEQKAKFEEFRKAFPERVRKEHDEAVQGILTPEQWKKFEEGRQKGESQGPQGPGTREPR